MAARAQMEQVLKAGRIQPQGHEIPKDQSTTYVLIQPFIQQLTLVVKQCFFHSSNKSDHNAIVPEAAIILQFLRCLGNVTSWNIRLYKKWSS